jgi:L-ascorbate metabolism protein UlaG (beta-lactamase superfamily)
MHNLRYFFGSAVLLTLLACGTGPAETTATDSAEATAAEQPLADSVRIHPVLHGSLVLEWGGQTVYIDPYGGADLYRDFASPDLVLITHPHGDHLNPETLSGLDIAGAELIAPQAVAEQLDSIRFGKVTVLANGETAEFGSIGIEAVPMYNLPDDDTSRHPKGWGNGYVLTMGDQRLYASGDTEDIPEMRNLTDIDIAFVCMNLPYTMGIEPAADAVIEFSPAVVYPYHYRNGDGTKGDVAQFKQLVNAGDPTVEVRLAQWYPMD